MTEPSTAREALIVEAVGEAARLIRQVEALGPVLNGICHALLRADTQLRNDLAGFERRMVTIAESAQTRTVQHLTARANEATRRSIDLQSRAMVDAAREAFGAEIGTTLQRLQQASRALVERRKWHWEGWLTHAAAAAAASAVTWTLAVGPWAR